MRDDVVTVAEERFRRHLAEELALFRHEMAREFALFRKEIYGEIGGLRQEFGGEIGKVRQEIANVRVEVATVKSDLTWRLFYVWSAHLVAIAGLLLAFFKIFGS